jgi:hypothetical protein
MMILLARGGMTLTGRWEACWRGSQALTAVLAAWMPAVFFVAPTAAQIMNPLPESPTEMASAIARTIEANSSKSVQGALSLRSATAHDNIVEVEYGFNDPTIFARNKAVFENSKIQLIRYYCGGGRRPFLDKGVVIHQIMKSPNAEDRLEMTIDRTSCASLQTPKLTDAQSLARMAEAVATRENAEQHAAIADANIRPTGADAHEGIVELHWTVPDPAVGAKLKSNAQQIDGFLRGYFCGRYESEIGQGVAIHHIFTLADGGAIADFTVNGPSCGL